MKNIYNILFTLMFVTSFSLYADNPGDEVVSADDASDAPVATEEVVAEEEVVTSDDAVADDEVVTLEKVVVTGSRIKRTQEEGALPLLVITKEDIDNSGFRSVTQALQSIPSANQYTQNESLTNNFTPNANE